MKKLAVLFSIFLFVSLCSVVCTGALNHTQQKEDKELTIVTSFYPVYIATENVIDGMDDVTLINLTENHSGCLHDYQLTTQDMRALEQADVFIMNGGGMESFVEDIAKQYPNLTIIDASEGIDFLESEGHSHKHGEEEEEDKHEHGHDEEEESEHDHGHEEEENAHVWMNPVLYQQQVHNIAAGLEKVDSDRIHIYEKNEKTYVNEIKYLIQEYKQLPDVSGQYVITFHDAFAYLAQFMKLEVPYSVDLDDDSGLSAGQIAQVVDCVKHNGVKMLFTEKQYSKSIASNVSNETDAKVYVLDALVNGSKTKDAYLEGMRSNLEVLKKALEEAGEK